MSVILAIDPGYERSAWVVYNTGTSGIRSYATTENAELLNQLRSLSPDISCVVIEQIESYGMAVGREVFETVYWSGRFAEAASPTNVFRLPRRAVKLELCGNSRARDANIRVALLDRFGGSKAKGTKREPGPLYGISGDLWAALGVAVTWQAAAS